MEETRCRGEVMLTDYAEPELRLVNRWPGLTMVGGRFNLRPASGGVEGDPPIDG